MTKNQELAQVWATNINLALQDSPKELRGRRGTKLRGNVCYQIYATAMYGYDFGDWSMGLDTAEIFRHIGDLCYSEAGLTPLTEKEIGERWHG